MANTEPLPLPQPEQPPSELAPGQEATAHTTRKFAPIIPYSYARTAHPTNSGETVRAVDILTGDWAQRRAASREGIAISPTTIAATEQNPDGFQYNPRKGEKISLAARAAVRSFFRRPNHPDYVDPGEPTNITPVRPDIPTDHLVQARAAAAAAVAAREAALLARQRAQAEKDANRAADQALKTNERQVRNDELDLKRQEQDLRRQELNQRRRAIQLREDALAQGIIPDDILRGSSGKNTIPADTEAQKYEKAMRRYNHNIELITRYENDPAYGSLFETARLEALHQQIQDEAWPLYEARLAELNQGRPDDEKIESVEKMPSEERRRIIDPIDRAHTAAYAGNNANSEVLRALTLARLKAVGKLREPKKP